jgi:hypothetical protein
MFFLPLYNKKSSPIHFSDDSKWWSMNPHGLTRGGRVTPARDGRDFVSSVASKAAQISRALHSNKQSRATFPPTSFVHQGGGSKEEARGDGLGNTVFRSRGRDAGSLGISHPQCNAGE